MTGEMSRAERVDLMKVVRLNVRVAKSSVAQREAELVADMEAQLSAQYRVDNSAWKKATAAVAQQIATANAEIASRCDELGVRPEFRPSLQITWYDRGENMIAGRRAELRGAGRTRIAAQAKAAKADIDAQEAKILTGLYASGLTSQAAHDFLASIPTAEELMPPVNIAELAAVRQIRA